MLKRINVVERAIINLYNLSVKQGDNIDKQGKEVNKLVAAQKETNERLDAVIFMAEKYFSGQNGKSQK